MYLPGISKAEFVHNNSDMRSSGLLKKYSVEKMFLEQHKLRKVIAQDCKEIMTEIIRKQKETQESLGIRQGHVPTLLKR